MNRDQGAAMIEQASKYRPSNATEGDAFQSKFCHNCRRFLFGEGCPIELETLFREIDDPQYPSEWRYVNGQPVCTAFEQRGDKPFVEPFRDDLTRDMFQEGP